MRTFGLPDHIVKQTILEVRIRMISEYLQELDAEGMSHNEHWYRCQENILNELRFELKIMNGEIPPEQLSLN